MGIKEFRLLLTFFPYNCFNTVALKISENWEGTLLIISLLKVIESSNKTGLKAVLLSKLILPTSISYKSPI